MNIEVLFFGDLRRLAATRQRVITMTEGTQLTHLIERLVKEYGGVFEEQINSTLNSALRILINGREYEILDGMETPLKDEDVVVFLPIIVGG